MNSLVCCREWQNKGDLKWKNCNVPSFRLSKNISYIMMQLFSDEVRFLFFSMHVSDGKSANRDFENVLAILIINKQFF